MYIQNILLIYLEITWNCRWNPFPGFSGTDFSSSCAYHESINEYLMSTKCTNEGIGENVRILDEMQVLGGYNGRKRTISYLTRSIFFLSTTLFSTWELEKLRPSISFWIGDIRHLRRTQERKVFFSQNFSTNRRARLNDLGSKNMALQSLMCPVLWF